MTVASQAGTIDRPHRAARRAATSSAVAAARVGRQLRNYLDRLRWVARDAFPRFRGAVIGVVILNLAGLLLAVAALGGMIMFVRHAEASQPMQLLGMTFELRTDAGHLLLYGAVIAVLGVLSAVCLYATEWLILRTTRAYERINTGRALGIAGDDRFRGWVQLVDAPPQHVISRMSSSGARLTAYAFRDMLRVILPLLTLIASVAFLFTIDGWLTLMLAPIVALYLVPLYLVNRRVARNQADYRAAVPAVRRRIGGGLRAALAGAMGDDAKRERWRRDALESDEYRAMTGALYTRLIADKRVAFLNAAFFIICLAALLVVFGMGLRPHERPWTALLSYLVALRFAVTALRQVSVLFVKFSRFFPEYRSYSQFIERADELRKRNASAHSNPQPLPGELVIRIGREPAMESRKRLSVRKGGVVWAITPKVPDRTTLEAIAALVQRRLAEPFELLARAVIVADVEQRNEAPRSGDVLVTTGRAVEHAGPPPMPDGYIIVVEDRVEAAQRIVERALGGRGDQLVLVIDGNQLVGGGDGRWLQQHRHEIERLLARRAQHSRTADLDDENDDPLDDD